MNKLEAADILSVPLEASVDQVRSRYQEMYSDYHIRLTNAPTPVLKKTYQQNLENLRVAAKELYPDIEIAAPENLPASAPVFMGDVPPATRSMDDGRGRKRTEYIETKALHENHDSSRAVTIAVVCCAVLGAIALLMAVLWTQARERSNALQQFLNSSPANQLDLLDQDSYKNSAPLLRQALQMMHNGSFQLCNDSTNQVTVNWLTATYLGEDDHKLHTFNSTAYDWHTWNVSAGGYKKPINLVEETSSVWDGSVITYAVGINYSGNDYVFSGLWANQKDGCLHLRLD